MTELEESRAGLEQAEKTRKVIETELHDAADRNSELNSLNSSLNGYKRKLENDITTLRADLDEAHSELKNSEERFKKSLNDSARLADELRAEQVNENLKFIENNDWSIE
jgi:myosin protein heavy chain